MRKLLLSFLLLIVLDVGAQVKPNDPSQSPFGAFASFIENSYDVKLYFETYLTESIQSQIDIEGETIYEILDNVSTKHGFIYREYSQGVFLLGSERVVSSMASQLDLQLSSLGIFKTIIEDRFGIKLFFKSELAASIESELVIKGETIYEVLGNALEDHELAFLEYSPGTFILGPEKEITSVLSLDYVMVRERFETPEIELTLPVLHVGDSLQKGKVDLANVGINIFDFKNDEPLIGAVFFIQELNQNAVSDIDGLINLEIPTGIHLCEIRLVGYTSFVGYLSVYSDGQLDIFLDEEILELDEVVITGEGAEQNVKSTMTGMVNITPRQIKELPTFLGEADVIKTMLTLPGVTTLGEGTSGFYVRGGNIDQNLVKQDGALLFNSSHALGFFSVFNPDLIQGVTLMKGHIPANYGGRLSSVLKVDLKSSISESFKISGGIGSVMSKLAIETPIVENKTSILLGGRISYGNYLLRLFKDPDIRGSSASFFDYNIRINQRISQSGSMYLSYYQSGDKVQYENTFGFDWQSNQLSFGYNQSISEVFFSEFEASLGSTRSTSFDPSGLELFDIESGQRSSNIKQTLIANWSQHETVVGAEWTVFDPLDERLMDENEMELESIERPGGDELGAFINDSWEAADWLSLGFGVRWSYYRTRSINNDPNIDFSNFEPRLSVRIATGPTSSIKASYNRLNQYLHLIANTSAALPNDQWFSATSEILPKAADNYSLGVYRNFELNRWETSIEGFYGSQENLAETRSFANLILNPNLGEDIIQGDGRTYGVEFYIKKNSGRLKGSMSYTYSRSEIFVDLESEQNPIWISSAIDRPHNGNINLNYTISRKAKFAMNFVYTSGRPLTAPTATYLVSNVIVPHYSERNQFKIPDYHRLDISYTIKRNAIKRKRYQDSFTFAIYNVYSRRNAYSVFFKKDQLSPASAFRLSVLGSAFPSITYNFNF